MRGWFARAWRCGGGIWLAVLIPLGVLGWHCLVRGRALGFPLDDSWIHLTYARNLAQHLEVALNPGQPSTGATSLLWMVLLSLGLILHLPAVPWSLFLGLAVYALYLAVMVALPLGDREIVRRSDVLFLSALAGPVLFYGLSGMETLLFVTLEFASLYLAIGRQRWGLGGLVGALAAMTRPEGILVLGPLFLFGLGPGRSGTPRARWISALALALGGLVIYLLVNYVVGGSLLPSSFSGRRNLASGSPAVTWSGAAFVSSLETLVSSWTQFVWTFGIGPVQVPGPALPRFTYAGLVWALMKGAWLALAGVGALRAWSRPDQSGRLVRALCLLVLEHDILYGLLLPNIGHAGRYLANNLLLLPLLAAYGGGFLEAGIRREGFTFRSALAVGGGRLLAYSVALVGAFSWAEVYSSAVEHIDRVHVAAGRWVAENVPPGELIAAFDIGAISFLGGHPLIDLGGLVDPSVLEDIRRHQLAARLMREDVHWLALPDWWESRVVLDRLGLGAIPLQALQVTSITQQQQASHWEATLNALPSIHVSRIRWSECQLQVGDRVICPGASRGGKSGT